MRNYDCAIQYFERSTELSTSWPQGYRALALVYAQKGLHEQALATMKKAMELGPRRYDFIGDLAFVQARAGQQALAQETLRRAKQTPLEPFTIGRAHVALGELDSAFVWLERASWRFPHRAYRQDPALDPVRKDPRFARLDLRIEREMGLRE
jgi:tetratricopeptide (TPR) repeat protein